MSHKKIKINIGSEDYCVPEGKMVALKKRQTLVKSVYQSKEKYQKLLEEQVAKLSALQHLLYASNRYSALLIIQKWMPLGKTASSSM